MTIRASLCRVIAHEREGEIRMSCEGIGPEVGVYTRRRGLVKKVADFRFDFFLLQRWSIGSDCFEKTESLAFGQLVISMFILFWQKSGNVLGCVAL